MIFTPTPLSGASLVDLEPRVDDRGSFARVFCEREFEAHGLACHMVQANVSFSRRRGTLRGMHWQAAPHGEDKLVRCIRGALWDAIVDLRPGSPSYCRWFGVELSEADGRMLFVPSGFAHGFVTLTDDVAVSYMMSAFHAPEAARGARHDDPAFAIRWPQPVVDMSRNDRTWPDFIPQDIHTGVHP